jgi:hypothetical protein
VQDIFRGQLKVRIGEPVAIAGRAVKHQIEVALRRTSRVTKV